MTPVDHEAHFLFWLDRAETLTKEFVANKRKAAAGNLRAGQTPEDLVLIYKKTAPAIQLRGDIAEAQTWAQLYGIAVIARRG